MRFTMPKGVEHHRLHRLPDELDGLLRAYFRAEMPHPWPGAPRATPSPRQKLPFWRRYHGRLALAAAVSFFLIGSFVLTQSFPTVTPTTAPGQLQESGPATGSDKQLHRLIAPNKKLQELPSFKADPSRLQMLPLEETPRNRSFGVRTKSGQISVIVVEEKKSP